MTPVRLGVRRSRRPATDPSGPGADVARQAGEAGRDASGADERVSPGKRSPAGVVEQGERCVEAAAAAGP